MTKSICILNAVLMTIITHASVASTRDPSTAALAQEVAELRNQVRLMGEKLEAIAKLHPATGPADAEIAKLRRRIAVLEGVSSQADDDRREKQQQQEDTQSRLATLEDNERQRAQITLYGNLEGGKFQNSNSTLNAESFELVFSGQPNDRLAYFTEIEFDQAASAGGPRGGEVAVEQAYVDLLLDPLANLRAGTLLVPFGNIKADHFSPIRDVIETPLTSQLLAPADFTDNGLGLYGSHAFANGTLLSYEAYVIAGLNAQIGTLGNRAARQPFGVDNNNDKTVSTRWAWNNGQGVEIGGSFYRGAYDDAGRHTLTGWAMDFLLEKSRWKITGEYNRFVAQVDGPNASQNAYYIRLLYTLPHAWLAGLHDSFPEAELKPVFEYDYASLDDFSDPTGPNNAERRYTVGLNFLPTPEWVLKFNLQFNHAKRAALVHGNNDGALFALGYLF